MDPYPPSNEDISASLDFYGEQDSQHTMLRAEGGMATLGLASRDVNGTVWLTAGKSGPRLNLSDKEGFRTVLGSTGLVTPSTGETHKTSAASLVLFDKGGHVTWSAP